MKKYIDIDDVYPIGSIYMNIIDINPSSFFGGEWEKIQDTFLLASGNIYTTGNIGGEASHQLTIDELPSHDHSFGVIDEGTARSNIPTWPESINPGENSADYWHINWTHQQNIDENFYPYTSWITGITPTGGNTTHNNMPPYLVVNIWKRVS